MTFPTSFIFSSLWSLFCYVNFRPPLIAFLTHLSQVIRKPAFGFVRPGNTQIGHSFLSYSLGISDIFNFVYYSYPLDSEQKHWSDRADALADLSLCFFAYDIKMSWSNSFYDQGGLINRLLRHFTPFLMYFTGLLNMLNKHWAPGHWAAVWVDQCNLYHDTCNFMASVQKLNC